MRYIQLQAALQKKVTELEKLCLQEFQLLEGKCKTHSLPSRRKVQKCEEDDLMVLTQQSHNEQRLTISSENIMETSSKRISIPTLVLAYKYLDPQCRYKLRPSSTSSSSYLLANDMSNNYDEQLVAKTPLNTDYSKQRNNSNTYHGKIKKSSNSCREYKGNFCNPCIKPNNNSDNISLDAYDLASPCCNPQCVPNSGRRFKSKKGCCKRNSKSEETQTDLDFDAEVLSSNIPSPHWSYLQLNSENSKCKSNNCTCNSCDNSMTFNEQNLSTDCVFTPKIACWNSSCNISRKFSNGCKISDANSSQYFTSQSIAMCHPQTSTVKPKSLDNLTTKANGSCYIANKESRAQNNFDKCYSRTSILKIIPQKKLNQEPTINICFTSPYKIQPMYIPSAKSKYRATKSTESLISVTNGLSESFDNLDVPVNTATLYSDRTKRISFRASTQYSVYKDSNSQNDDMNSMHNTEATRL